VWRNTKPAFCRALLNRKGCENDSVNKTLFPASSPLGMYLNFQTKPHTNRALRGLRFFTHERKFLAPACRSRNQHLINLIGCESLCLLKILAKERLARKKAILVSTFLRKLVRTLAWISRRHKLSPLINCLKVALRGQEPFVSRTHKRRTGQKSRAPCIFFSPLLDFVAPYWLSVLPP
jgi:hypothetical protein